MHGYGWLATALLLAMSELAVGQVGLPPQTLPADARQNAQPLTPTYSSGDSQQPALAPANTPAGTSNTTGQQPDGWWNLDTGVTRTTFFEQAASGALNPLRQEATPEPQPGSQPGTQPTAQPTQPKTPTSVPTTLPSALPAQSGTWAPDRWNAAARTAALPTQAAPATTTPPQGAPPQNVQPQPGGNPQLLAPSGDPQQVNPQINNPALPQDPQQVTTGQTVNPNPAVATDPGQSQPPAEPSKEPAKPPGTLPMIEAGIADVQARIAEAEANAELNEETKPKVLAVLNKAMEWLNLARDSELQRRQYEQESVAGPEIIGQVKAQLAQELPPIAPPDQPDATLSQLEAQLSAATAELEAAQKALNGATEDLKKRTQRRTELGQLSEEVAKRLKEAIASLKNPPKEGLHPVLVAAHQLELQARRVAAEVQLQLFKAESMRLEAVTELLPLQRDLAKRNATWHEQHTTAWKEFVAEFRKLESQRQAKLARKAAAQAHPKLQDIANLNAQLTQQRTEYAAKIETTNERLEFAKNRLKGLTESLNAIHEKVEIGGLSMSIGHLLRRQREELPDLAKHQSRLAEIEVALPEVQLQAIDLVELRTELGRIDETVADIVDSLEPADVDVSPEEIEAMAREFLDKQREYVDALSNDLDAYQDILGELDLATRKLISQTHEYQAYIDEHVLWIRSADSVSSKDAAKAAAGLGVIFELKQWQSLFSSVWKSVKQRPLGTVFVIGIFFGGLFLRRWSAGKKMTDAHSNRRNESSLHATMRALLAAVLVAGIAPIAAWLVGSQLVSVAAVGSLAHAFGLGLSRAAALFFATEFARQLLAPRGLAEVHFGWPDRHLKSLRWSLLLLIVGGVPLYFVGTASTTFQNGEWSDSLGRLTFLAGMLLLSVVVFLASRPARAILEERTEAGGSQLLAFTLKVVQPLAVAIPLTLGLLAIMGYYYSAQQLAVRLKWMFWIGLAISIGHNIASRIVGIVHKQLVKKRRAILRAKLLSSEEGTPNVEMDDAQEAVRVGVQVRRLLQGATLTAFLVSCWFVWAEAMPALQILDRVELWSVSKDVTETVAAADGTKSQTIVKQIVPVTLTHVFLCAAIVALTLLAARNLPGLLQMVVLERLPIDRGGKHAIALLGRYLVTVCGAIWAFNIIGMTWGSIQWLIAAMTVGLGFGLQEIFANFVAGVIILFERPIRIGDLVTVGGTTGTVTRMQIRATTITDFDRRELLVPNKSFITQEVINWTLSDSTSRVVIPVGIAYGSNTKLAEETLLKLANENPLILNEPAPMAIFCNFGDSTLNFELRFYLATRDHYVQVLHGMNNAIDQAFREANIEIAFPQQDLHIRGLPEALANEVAKTRRKAGAEGKESSDNSDKRAA